MPTQQDFLPFAAGAGANVISQASYAALAALSPGFSAGLAASNQLNKVWRQSSIMAAVLGDLIVAEVNAPVIDDGTTATILSNLVASIRTASIPASTIALDGYVKLGNGIIIQWGAVSGVGTGGLTVTLPIAFPTAAFVGFATVNTTGTPTASAGINILGTSSIELYSTAGSQSMNYLVIGH